MSAATLECPRLQIAVGPARFDPGLPVLAGEAVEELFAGAVATDERGCFALFRHPDWDLGVASLDIESSGGHDGAARRIYRDLFAAARGLHLARVWNYVPGINAPGPDGLENYRAFCRGRSLAFEEFFGAGFQQFLPAASAVGCADGRLTVAFAATTEHPRHCENPLQVPAYRYPGEYGPRAPSFARATVVPLRGREAVFISGTAAIRGHATIAPESTLEQLDCTLENLRAISRVCGLGDDLAAGRRTRHFKVYLRHAEDYAPVAALLDGRFFRTEDDVSYVLADICRANLKVEIEATLL